LKDHKVLTFEFEDEQHSKGFVNVCGVDEAGRGPLAGNVVAGAVIIPDGVSVEGINDSKKLSEKKRDELYDYITSNMVWSVAWASPKEIDELNILNATMLAMKRAIEKLSIKADFALIDGNCSRGFSIPTKTVIGGDAKSPSIAAASIIAKVTRDRQCLELDEKYPEYGFKKHKGYPTKDHMDAVRKLGPCPEHRISFLKFLNNE